MAVNSQTSLVDLLDGLGLRFQENADYQNLEKAEQAISVWLQSSDLSRDLKLIQTLWVNGQHELGNRYCHKQLLDKVREHQKGGTSGPEGLLLAQGLLIHYLVTSSHQFQHLWSLLAPLEGTFPLPEKLHGLIASSSQAIDINARPTEHLPLPEMAAFQEQLIEPSKLEAHCRHVYSMGDVSKPSAGHLAAASINLAAITATQHVSSQLTPIHGLLLQKLESSLAQIDLLWWGEAMFSHRRRKRFASLPAIEAAFFLALELSERAPLNTPVQALESYLMERLKHLQRDGHLKSDEKKHFSEWLKALGEAVELRTTYDADPKLDAVVKSDAWLLPLSYFRAEGLISSPAKAINSLESKTGYRPDFELSLEQLACQCLRELLLNRRFKEASTQGAAS